MGVATDPCFSTILFISPLDIENLIAFAGYEVSSVAQYTINDSVSIQLTTSADP